MTLPFEDFFDMNLEKSASKRSNYPNYNVSCFQLANIHHRVCCRLLMCHVNEKVRRRVSKAIGFENSSVVLTTTRMTNLSFLTNVESKSYVVVFDVTCYTCGFVVLMVK